MKLLAGVLPLATVCWFGDASAQATLEGSVTLPKFDVKTVQLPRYPGQIVQPSPPPPPTAIVYLEGNFSSITATASPPIARMSQRGLQFIPNLLPIRIGTNVEFPNLDEIQHNVLSYSKQKRFDLGRYGKDESPAVQRFDKPGLVRLNCDVHPHMRAYILVLDSPFFTLTDTNGSYRLENLPAGRFALKTWVSERITHTRQVDLKTGETLRVDFRSGSPGT